MKKNLPSKQKPNIQPPSEKLSNKEEILKRLYNETEAPIEKQETDAHLDSLNDVKRALSITAINVFEKYISKKRNVYKVRFREEFYIGLYKFMGITVTKENKKKLMRYKPRRFARWTIEIIYNRFPRGTVGFLRRGNVKVNGVFLFKHFQHLSDVGLIELEEYIDDAIRLMGESAYWNQFLRKLSRLNNKPFQLDIFDTE